MIEYFKLALSRWNDFQGRSRRSEFWYFYLGFVLIVFGLSFLGGIIGGATGSEAGGIIPMVLLGIVSLVFIVPFLACAVRRLHDSGKSGWWLLISIIPLGGIVLFVFYCLDSEPGANKWGPNPKTGALADDVTSHKFRKAKIITAGNFPSRDCFCFSKLLLTPFLL